MLPDNPTWDFKILETTPFETVLSILPILILDVDGMNVFKLELLNAQSLEVVIFVSELSFFIQFLSMMRSYVLIRKQEI